MPGQAGDIGLPEGTGQLAGTPVADRRVVDADDRHDERRRAGDERLARGFRLLQGEAALAILKGIGVLAIEAAQLMEDVWNMTAQAAATALKAVGYAMQEIAQAMEQVWQMTTEAIVFMLHEIGASVDELVQMVMALTGLDEVAATALVCVALPPFVCLL